MPVFLSVQRGTMQQCLKTTPFLYSLAGYSEETGEHTLQAINPTEAVRTLSVGQKTNTASTQVVYDVSLYHTAAWKITRLL